MNILLLYWFNFEQIDYWIAGLHYSEFDIIIIYRKEDTLVSKYFLFKEKSKETPNLLHTWLSTCIFVKYMSLS